MPKSVTSPIALEIIKKTGGIKSLAVVVIIITGVLGSVIAPLLFRWFGINDKIARGLALGSASHGVGSAKAMEMGETEGAMAALSIGLMGVATMITINILVNW